MDRQTPQEILLERLLWQEKLNSDIWEMLWAQVELPEEVSYVPQNSLN